MNTLQDPRDLPDDRSDEPPDFDSLPYRFGAMPCGLFRWHRQQQSRTDYEYHRELIEKQDCDIPIRKRARRAYRTLRQIGLGYRECQPDLYAPKPPPALVSWAAMQKSGYWYEQEEMFAKLERIFIAAAKTYESQGRHDLAEQYWRAADDVHGERLDTLSAATALRWYEEHGYDL